MTYQPKEVEELAVDYAFYVFMKCDNVEKEGEQHEMTKDFVCIRPNPRYVQKQKIPS
jgi:hypothetical protein